MYTSIIISSTLFIFSSYVTLESIRSMAYTLFNGIINISNKKKIAFTNKTILMYRKTKLFFHFQGRYVQVVLFCLFNSTFKHSPLLNKEKITHLLNVTANRAQLSRCFYDISVYFNVSSYFQRSSVSEI